MHETNTTTSASPTPYAELNGILGDLAVGIQTVLGNNFVGFYLQGSFAIGDYDVHSDCDFIVVINHELSLSEVDALQNVHAAIFDRNLYWAKHLEGSYFPKDVLRDTAYAGGKLWYLDHGSRSLIQDAHCNTVLVRWVVRGYGIPLIGLPPQTLVDAIPASALRKQILTVMNDWGRELMANPEPYNNVFYQAFIVHNYSRMLHDLVRSYPGSKRAGTDWVKANLDPAWHGLIDRSWAGRGDAFINVRTPANPADFAATLRFVEYIIQQANGLDLAP
jgi:hypothetical protein